VATVLSAVALLAVPAAAQAVTLISPTANPAIGGYQRWADGSAVPTVGGHVRLLLRSCPLSISDGCIVYDAEPTIYLGSAVRDRSTLLHELGHAFDAAVMSDADRLAFAAVTEDRRDWQTGPNSLKERFAEAYGLCARHARIHKPYAAAYGYRVSPAQHRGVCRVIRIAAAHGPLGQPAALVGS